jgi:hypothetical protein
LLHLGGWQGSLVSVTEHDLKEQASWQERAAAPAWEAFPEVNRVLAGCLLGLLVERMVRAAGAGVSAVSVAARLPWERAEGKASPGIVTGWRRTTCYLN